MNGQIRSYLCRPVYACSSPEGFKMFQSNSAKLAGQQPGARLLHFEYTWCICMWPSENMSEPKLWEAIVCSLPGGTSSLVEIM